MSRSRTIRYTIHTTGTFNGASNLVVTPMEWVSKNYGKPTNENLATTVKGYEDSTVTGYNKHLGIWKILEAKIVDNMTGKTIATYKGA